VADPQGRLHALRGPGLPEGPFNIPRISKKDNKAYKCTLCSDRVAVGLEPACVKTCPTGAIQFGAKSDMVKRGDKRVGDLKERGYQQAGLYNPAGVGGTHVMYVLQHADKPSLYNDLPLDPKISPWVSPEGRGTRLPLEEKGRNRHEHRYEKRRGAALQRQ